MPLDIAVACKAITHGKTVYDFVTGKSKELMQTLGQLQAAMDQQITREILGAYEALANSVEATGEGTRHRYLDFAEQSFLKNTNLNPSLTTAGKPNSYYIALAYLGLSSICLVRDESRLAVRFVYSAFRFDPNECRSNHVPEVYEAAFKDHCTDIQSWHGGEMAKINSHDYAWDARVVSGKGIATAMKVGGGILSYMSGRPQEVYYSVRASEQFEEKWSSVQ